jgi:hypothetical protein
MTERREGPDRRVRDVPVAVERRWAFRRDSDIEAAIRKMVKLVQESKRRKTRKTSPRPVRRKKKSAAPKGRRTSSKKRRR